MAKHVLLTGGTGFIGTKLCEYLLQQGHNITIFTRNPSALSERWGKKINAIRRLDQIQEMEQIDWVINLAGEPIMNGRWNNKRKHAIVDSRIQVTKHLISQLAQRKQIPEVMISGSAIGYYGDHGDEPCTEQTEAGEGFSAELCKDWEKAAHPITVKGARLCVLRTGIVLDAKGGALKRMMGPFKMGLGGKLGAGNQWMSWIHLDDLCRMILFIASRPDCKGPFNGTAPDPVTNEIFTKTLGEILNRPTVVPMPALALKLVLGEASELLLGSQQVIPEKALQQGFNFKYETLDECLAQCFAKKPPRQKAS